MGKVIRMLSTRQILLLLGCTLLSSPKCVVANYLTAPQWTNRWDTNEPMLQGNGITGSADGRVFATTQAGNLWIFSPLQTVEPEPVVFTPSPWVDDEGQPLTVQCRSSVVLKETLDEEILYAVYAVIDSTPDGRVVQSRVLGVDPDDGTLLWFIVLSGSSAVGTPVIGQDYIYVVHNDVDNEAGQLTIIEVSADNQASVVETFNSAGAPWGPPSVTSYPEGDDTWKDAVVWGDSLDEGRNRLGSTHLLKVGDGIRVWQTLSDFTGSTITPPTLGQITSGGNNQYSWNVATGNYNGLVHVWAENTDVDWNEVLSSRESTDPTYDPTWWETATSFTTGTFPMQVSPVFSASATFVFVASPDGGIAAWGADRGRRQWEIPTLVHLSQPIVHVPPTLSNNNPAVLYACDARGTIRQIEANNRGGLNWQRNYCQENFLSSCPDVSANLFVSKNGNRLFLANEEGTIFGARVATFATPAPAGPSGNISTTAPTLRLTTTPTSAPTGVAADTSATDAPSGQKPAPDDENEEDGASDGEEVGDTAVNDGDNKNEDESGTNRGPDIVEPGETSAPSSPPLDPNSGLGASALRSDSESSSNGLYIVLGIVIFALCVCVGGATIYFKRRRKSKQIREKEIQDEMAAVRRWKSSKKMYEQEMRDEEEATMQELSNGSPRRSMSSEESEDPSKQIALVTPPQKEKLPRSRSRSRTRAQSSTPGTLGSISESVDEDIGSPTDTETGSGVEITVVDAEADSGASLSRNLAFAFASDDTPNTKKTENCPKQKVDSAAEQLLNEDDPDDSEPLVSKKKFVEEQATAESSKEDGDLAQSSDAITSRRPDSRSTSSAYLQEDEKSDMHSQVSGVTEEPGAIKPYIPPPATSPPDIHTTLSADDDKSDMTSLLSGLSAQSHNTDEPGAIKSSPKKVHYLPTSPCASDLMSVDSSVYLDDNTAASPMPPADPLPINQPQPTPPPPPPPTPPRKTLDPPEGASVAGSPLSSAKSVDSVASDPDGTTPSVMMPALSIASDETAKRSNSKERPSQFSSTKVHSRMMNPKPLGQTLYTKPAVEESTPQSRGRTRAGLFSRRDLRREPSESSASIQSSNMSYSEWSESVSAASSTNEDMKIVGKASSVTSSKTVASAGKRPQKPIKPKPKAKQSKPEQGRGDEENPWNSFLNQLAKVEEEFFNPTLPGKAAAPATQVQKTQRQYGRKRSGKPSFPPPLPPSSHTDIYFKKKEDQD